MNDDLNVDSLDAELRRRFGSGAAPDADPDVVLDAMRPQLQRARTRRRASIAGAVGGIAAIVVVLVFALAGGGGSDSSVRTPPASQGSVNTVPPAPTTAPSGVSPTADTVPDDHGVDDTTATTPTTPEAATPTEAPPETSPAPRDETYTSAGGSIVVHFDRGVVSLASSSPAAGYTAEVHDNGPSRVEVRFENGQTEWRIRVDVVNGQLQPEVSQH